MLPDRFDEIRRTLVQQLDMEREMSDVEILEVIDDLIMEQKVAPVSTLREKVLLRQELFDSVRRLDVLQELIEDPSITEIMVNGPERIFVEREGKMLPCERRFTSEEKLLDVIQQIAGKCNRVINESMPIVDARLEDGARINAVVAPVALDGPILTIRRFPKDPFTMERLLGVGSLTEECAEFLKQLVRARYSMLIGGGTGSGKTTFLGALAQFIPESERLITIEDNAELQIREIPNLVRLEAKRANMEGGRAYTIRDLIRTALRMRPDRICVGEVRGEEALDMLQALNTGHDGSLCTAHANSTADMLTRMETMVLMGMPLPLTAVRRQISAGIDILIHLGRMRDGSRKVLEVTEVVGMEGEEIRLSPLFAREESGELVKVAELTNAEKWRRVCDTKN